MEEVQKAESKKSIIDYAVENKAYIYPVMMYAAGLISGLILFKFANKSLLSLLSELFTISNTTFQEQILNHFCLYFSIYVLTVLFGLCLIGFPILNIIPLSTGLLLAIKLSYFYATYSAKGIGYSILMIIPEGAVYVTVLIFTIVKSNEMSRSIFDLISKKSDMTKEINLKSYLKAFLFYAIIVAVISLMNASSNFLLSSIISI